MRPTTSAPAVNHRAIVGSRVPWNTPKGANQTTPASIATTVARTKPTSTTVPRDPSRTWTRGDTTTSVRSVELSSFFAFGRSSYVLADAHVVAAAVESGGGVVLTGDDHDLELLAAASPNVQVSVI